MKTLTDFLGREYGPGDLVIYGVAPGRSVNMVVGRVTEIYEVYQSRDTYRWKCLADGEQAPLKTRYGWLDAAGTVHPERAEGLTWREYETDEREETHVRVKIQPLGASRWEQHSGHDYWVDTRTGKRIDPTRGTRHIKTPGHYVFADGRVLDLDKLRAMHEKKWADPRKAVRSYNYPRDSFDAVFARQYHVNSGAPGEIRLYGPERDQDYRTDEQKARIQLWWVPDVYHDYVEERHEAPKAVTIEVIRNIVRWDGPDPSQVKGAFYGSPEAEAK